MTMLFGAQPMTAIFTEGAPPNAPPKIERGIPIPTKSRNVRQTQYPFTKMSVGDSFKVPVRNDRAIIRRLRHSLVGQAGGVTRAAGIKAKFVTHYMPDENAVRIWRVK